MLQRNNGKLIVALETHSVWYYYYYCYYQYYYCVILGDAMGKNSIGDIRVNMIRNGISKHDIIKVKKLIMSHQ